MRAFATYIEYLLMTRHYCYVPGIGAYMMSDESAAWGQHPIIGEESHRFNELSAPRRAVRFSPLHTHDDGMLANLLMEAEGMTYDEACRYIERQVPLLSEDFAASASLHTDTDNFGFEALRLETWSDIEARLNKRNVTDKKDEGKSNLTHSSHRDTISIPKFWIKRAAVVLLIALFFFTNFIGLNQGNTQLASVLNVAALQRGSLVHQTWDEADETINALGNTSTENLQYSQAADETSASELTIEPKDTNSPEALAETVLANGPSWFVIVECSTSEDLAQKALKRYRNSGFDKAGIMVTKTGCYRIFVECYNDRSEAANSLRRIHRSSEHLAHAWLLPVEDASLSLSIVKNKYNDNQLSLELSHPNQRTERDQG